jgi:hypothetical protein
VRTGACNTKPTIDTHPFLLFPAYFPAFWIQWLEYDTPPTKMVTK